MWNLKSRGSFYLPDAILRKPGINRELYFTLPIDKLEMESTQEEEKEIVNDKIQEIMNQKELEDKFTGTGQESVLGSGKMKKLGGMYRGYKITDFKQPPDTKRFLFHPNPKPTATGMKKSRNKYN